MSTKSEVVGHDNSHNQFLLGCSQKEMNDMTSILIHLQRYVPCKATEKQLDMDPFMYTDYEFVRTLVGGDQLSTARVRGCMMVQENSQNYFDKINGLLPVSEDRHTKVCFMEVS